MLVVSNTSPISYLVLIDHIDLLPSLFETITIPETVREELSSSKAPLPVQTWIKSPPIWISLQSTSPSQDSELLKLDAGERAAISLAETLKADLILLDDLAARRVAANRGLTFTGVLGILDRAAILGLIDFADAIAKLRQTNFRASSALMQKLIQKHALSEIP
jgi:predicted nucleic acid-binding protein